MFGRWFGRLDKEMENHGSRSTCPQCGAVKLPHRVCGNCGYYNKREVIEVE